MNPYPEITLTRENIAFCEDIGSRRYANAVARGLAHGAPMGERAHIAGALAECAAYRHFGPVYWNAHTLDVGEPDLDHFIDVKWRGAAHHKLIVGEKARRDWAYLLVCGAEHPLYRIVGWAWGDDAMQPMWWNPANHTPAYYLPARFLSVAATLMSELRRRQASRLKGVAL